jgi:hypothetical protein
MEYINWCILQGNFCADIKISKDFWQYKQFKVMAFDSKTNKIVLIGDNGVRNEFILDYKKMDSYFVTNKKTEQFEKFLKSYERSS